VAIVVPAEFWNRVWIEPLLCTQIPHGFVEVPRANTVFHTGALPDKLIHASPENVRVLYAVFAFAVTFPAENVADVVPVGFIAPPKVALVFVALFAAVP
jgi:hypothetical protein